MMVVIGGILTQVVARQFARCPRLIVRMAQQVVAGDALVERRKKSLASHDLPHIVFVQQLHMTIREGLSTPQLPVARPTRQHQATFPARNPGPSKTRTGLIFFLTSLYCVSYSVCHTLC